MVVAPLVISLENFVSSFTARLGDEIFSPGKKDMSDKMSVDKKDPSKDDSEDSMESSPEGEVPSAAPAQHAENQQPKRKGGRKPVC